MRSPDRGFSLVELIVITALIATVIAIAVPSLSALQERMRLGQTARVVERAIQQARQKAVNNNRAMRVRFNCPSPGQYRVVELLGRPSAPVAADDTDARCSESLYPFPAPDSDPATLPNLDGPIQRLDEKAQFGTVMTLEFWPDGSVHAPPGVSPWPLLPTTGSPLTITQTSGSTVRTATITVNGIGRIKLDPVR